jgi:hypothetical protein
MNVLKPSLTSRQRDSGPQQLFVLVKITSYCQMRNFWKFTHANISYCTALLDPQSRMAPRLILDRHMYQKLFVVLGTSSHINNLNIEIEIRRGCRD